MPVIPIKIAKYANYCTIVLNFAHYMHFIGLLSVNLQYDI